MTKLFVGIFVGAILAYAIWHICCSKGSIILHNSEIGGTINENQIVGAISYKPYFNNEL